MTITASVTLCPEMGKVVPWDEIIRILRNHPDNLIRIDCGRFSRIEDAVRHLRKHIETDECRECEAACNQIGIDRLVVPAISR